MKPQTIEEKVEWYAMLHKQNLNGRETEDELFEAGILAGIEETEELRDEFVIEFAEWCNTHFFQILGKKLWCKNLSMENTYTAKELLEIFKIKKAL
jgi:hypothetical protein